MSSEQQLIQRKFGRRLAHLMPVYEAARAKFLATDGQRRLILKTIYVLFDTPAGLASVMFFRDDHLEFGFHLPQNLVQDLELQDATHMGFPSISGSLKIAECTRESIETVCDLLEKSTSFIQTKG